MSSNEEVTIPLKYWVDDDKKRVIVAEASGELVDVLFSFLTLPLGTIIRLLGTLDHVEHNNNSEQEGTCCINKLCQSFKDMLGLRNSSQQQVELGCINELYKSVNNLDANVFRNKICQKMLRSLRNPLESSCQRLKLKVDDSELTKYFMCHNCSKKGSNLLVSSFYDVKCDCGSLMRKEIEMLEEPAVEDGVFVKGKAMFFIYDNLTVRRSSPSEFIKPPLKPRHKELKNYIEVPLDRKKILNILKQALTSETPLSDVLLGKKSKRSVSFSKVIGSSDSKGYLEIKVMVSKSENKIRFVEADGDFVDFLASFLATPLGSIMNLKNKKLSCYPIPLLASILKLRNGRLSLGSIRNLYKSVKNLDPSWFIESSKKSLLNQKVALHFGCEKNPLLNPSQDDTAKYWYGLGEMKNENGRIICEKRMISKKHDMLQQPKDIKMLDPRSSDRKKKDGVGFMKRPCLFVVHDNLELKELTNNSLPISFSDSENHLSTTDLEEHLLKIRKTKAINLLRASLTSDKGAFTRSLSCLLWKWRLQRLIPFWGWWRNRRNKKREKRKRRKFEKNIELNEKKEKKKQEKDAVKTKKDQKEEINNNSVEKTKEEVKA